jgi:carboxyl-terminal processing protease
MRRPVWLLALLAASLACNTLLPGKAPRPTQTHAPPTPTLAPPTQTIAPATQTLATLTQTLAPPTPTLKVSETLRVSPTVAQTATPAKGLPGTSTGAGAARTCDFVPGVSVAAQMPAALLTEGTPTPEPPPALPTNTPVDAATNARHLLVFNELISTVQQDYVYTDVVKNRLPGLQRQYKQLVGAGLDDDDFYLAMDDLINALGDNHSYFESPEEAKATDAGFTGNNDFVGIGVFAEAVPEAGRAVIVVVFPGGPAAQAGLRIHDSIVAVDGQPVLDASGGIRDTIRGPEGSTVALTVQRPGQPQFVAKLTRSRVTGALPIEACLIPSQRLGYIYLPSLDDETIPDQVRAALRAMTAAGPLTGLVIDNRQNGGGLNTVLDPLLSMFTRGDLGRFVARDESRQLKVQPEDVGGSQSVPLLVLVSRDTVSYGEVMSGLLQVTGRAKVMGQTSLGNVETEWSYTFKDGSRVWLAHELFQPPGLPLAVWEGTGIKPDIPLPVRWDLFTEGTDPALAAAVDFFK